MLLQRQAPSIRLHTTAHLAQTMTLLGLTAVELRQKIEAELASNPALELVEERRCPHCRRLLSGSGPCPVCSRPQSLNSEQPIVFVSPREDFHTYTGSGSSEAPDEGYTLTPATEDLPHFVLRQIAPELKPEDRPIAASILTNLDDDGLLGVELIEIARYHHVTLARVREVLRLIQRAEPVGVASPSPKEALLVQLEVLGETRQAPPLAYKAVELGMDLLSRHKYLELGHLLKIPASKARELARFISENLNPFPARAHWGETTGPQSTELSEGAFHNPDIIINPLNDGPESPFVVEIALPLAGTLRINPLFREAIRQAPAEKSEQWKSDLERATLLVKCLQQRNHTIVRLMQRLTMLQRKYILHGDAYLLPVTRACLAKELDVHESTISRAVAGKAVQLPNGHIVPLSTFFDRSLNVRTVIKRMIEDEAAPLSDTDIVQRLAKEGFSVARRTVAKYRAMEGILPAHLRKSIRI